ncbi:MAG TPA: hypothetical protein ENN36_02710 [Candidatus Bathyarchaeota archaeon]|nr:hypothetical protein [Candidatus Bathyarchaeota archaeon]
MRAKITMVLYVVYRAPVESTHRSAIPNRLKELGCQQLHRAFWKIDEKKAHRVLKVLENNQPILLRRLREIKNPQLARKKEFTGFGSLVLVMFKLPKDANREKVKNFLRRAPCIRLRRSVYAFCQKHRFYDKEQKLVDALKFANFIRSLQGEVKIISRVVIVNRESAKRLLQETIEHVEKEVVKIVESCKEIYMKVRDGNDLVLLRDRFSRIRKRLSVLKKVAAFYEGWLKIDLSKKLMRAYHALRKVNSIIQRKQI